MVKGRGEIPDFFISLFGRIYRYINMEEDFENLIEELYPDGIEETRLNDILRFDSDWVLEVLGISEEEEEEDFD